MRNLKKRLGVTSFILFVVGVVLLPAQTLKVLGSIVNEQKQPVPSANIECLDQAGLQLAGVAADSQGRFTCKVNTAEKMIRLKVSSIGFVTYELDLQTTGKEVNIGTIILRTADNMLGEVTVTGNQTVMKDEKMMIFPSKEQIRHSYDGYSALAMLAFPGLDVDLISRSVTSNGSSPVLCINGRSVSADEVRTLNPKDIQRIDYYQHFRPEFPSAAAVVDFILVQRDHGGTFVANVNENLNKITGDDIIDAKFYHKKSEFSIQLAGNYDHYTPDRGEESLTLLPFPEGIVNKSITTSPSPLHKNSLSGKLSYFYRGKQDQFQASVYLRNTHQTDYQQMSQKYSGSADEEYAKDNTHSDNLSPVFRLYYKHKGKHKQQFTMQVDGSYNHTTLNRLYESGSGQKIQSSYLSRSKEDFYYLVPQINYLYPVKYHRFFADMFYYYRHSQNTYTENGKNTDSKLVEGQGIFSIGDAYYKPKYYSLTFYLTDRMMTVNNGIRTKTSHHFSPKLFYTNYQLKNQLFGITAAYGLNSPEMQHYNSSEKQVDTYQTLVGNPELRIAPIYTISPFYQYMPKWGVLALNFQYECTEKNIYEQVYFDQERRLFVHTYQNGGSYQTYVGSLKAQVKLVPNKLTWTGILGYNYESEKSWEKQTISKVIYIWNGVTIYS